jgi:hypothetical protein
MKYWKRPKTMVGKTEHVETECGTLHYIKNSHKRRVKEIYATIGKNGTCPNCLTDTICKLTSMYLQSPEPRYKIIKKIEKQFINLNCGQPFFKDGTVPRS